MTRSFALLGAVLLLAVSIAGATTLVKMGFSDLARDADQVVVGTVAGIQGEWDPSGRFIHSTVTLVVERSLRGNTPDTLILRTPGGQVGTLAQRADGMATFEVGEKVLVFLTTWEDGTPKVLGYVQGKSRVIVDGQGRERLVGGEADGRTLAGVEQELRHGPNHNISLRPAN